MRTCIDQEQLVLWSLTFELSGRQRQDASARAVKMYRVPPAGRWWPAVGAPLERSVRQHFVRERRALEIAERCHDLDPMRRPAADFLAVAGWLARAAVRVWLLLMDGTVTGFRALACDHALLLRECFQNCAWLLLTSPMKSRCLLHVKGSARGPRWTIPKAQSL